MNTFDELEKTGGIPLVDAASFFVNVKKFPKTASAMSKTAGWQDPPDETGLLEGQFLVPVEQAVALMSQCATHLLGMMSASLTYSNSMRGDYSEAVRSALCASDWDFKHAYEFLVSRMSVLAGAPHIGEPVPPPASIQPVEIAKRMIRGQQEMIQMFRELLGVIGENPMKSHIEGYMSSYLKNIDALWKACPPEAGAGLPQLAGAEEAVEPAMDEELMAAFGEGEEAPSEGAPAEEPPAEEEASEEPAEEAPKKTAAALPKSESEFQDMVVDQFNKGRLSAIQGNARARTMDDFELAERVGDTLGRLGGAVGGAALGRAATGGNPVGLVGGGALGYLAGGKLGKELGREVDAHRGVPVSLVGKDVFEPLKTAAARMVKRAFGEDGVEPAEAPMASPTEGSDLQPTNYLEAEMMGQRAQEANEANFFRQKAQRAMQEAAASMQMSQDQSASMQMELDQLRAQSAQTEQIIQQANAEAMAARDEALKSTQVAANMRMGMQALRQAIIETVSQDPAPAAANELAMITGMQAPMADPGMMPGAGPSGEPPSVVGGMPPEGGGQPPPAEGGAEEPPPEEPKTAGALGAGLGAALGAGAGLYTAKTLAAMDPEEVRNRVRMLEQTQDGSYASAIELARAKATSIQSDLAQQFPGRSMLQRGAHGALLGAARGHIAENAITKGFQAVQAARGQ